MIANLYNKCKTIFSFAIAALFGAVIAIFGNSYVGFLEHNRAAIETDFGSFKNTSSDLLQLLDSYSSRAKNGTNIDDQTRTRLRLALLKAYSEAESIEKREPRVHDEFADYARSLLQLGEVANGLTGPLDARKFVEVTSDYLHANSKFESKIAELQKSYFKSLF